MSDHIDELETLLAKSEEECKALREKVAELTVLVETIRGHKEAMKSEIKRMRTAFTEIRTITGDFML